MDEFNFEVPESDVIHINAKTISESRGKMLVLGVGDYNLDVQIKQMPGVELVNPKSSLGKFLENDENVLRAVDFLDSKSDDFFDYSMISHYSLKKKDEKLGFQSEVESISDNDLGSESSSFVFDDYNKHKGFNVTEQKVLPLVGYQSSVPEFVSQNSWYNQPQNRRLESILSHNVADSYYRRKSSNVKYY